MRYALFSLICFLMLSCVSKSNNDMHNSEHDDMTQNCIKQAMEEDGIIRLSKIEVYPEYLNEYLKYAVEVGQCSLLTEPGVLAMYSMQEKADSCKITILEIYASQDAYKKHIGSEHFQKYKQATLHMVKSLELCDQIPLNERSVLTNTIKLTGRD